MFVYGLKPVLELLKSDSSQVKLLYVSNSIKKETLDQIRKLSKDVLLKIVPKEFLFKIAKGGNHQGVVMEIKEYEYLDFDDALIRTRRGGVRQIVLVLDNICDPQNLGAIIRTAEAAGVSFIVIPQDNAVQVTPTVFKLSAGALTHLPVVKVVNISRALEELKKEKFWVVGTTCDQEKKHSELVYDFNVALVMGSEEKGLRELVKKKCDFLINIPMVGNTNSLNVSVATGILLFEIRRQWGGSINN